jgi:hypothetical protein
MSADLTAPRAEALRQAGFVEVLRAMWNAEYASRVQKHLARCDMAELSRWAREHPETLREVGHGA